MNSNNNTKFMFNKIEKSITFLIEDKLYRERERVGYQAVQNFYSHYKSIDKIK